jgi:hypothetical protein
MALPRAERREFQAFLVLHELGQMTGAFGSTNDDGFDKANRLTNNTPVDMDCFGKTYNPNQ